MKLRRNNPNHPLVSNGPTRHGQFAWHGPDCQVEIYDTTPQCRPIWCATHGQWAHEYPTEHCIKFADGTTFVNGEER
jgi:hypothetical protein